MELIDIIVERHHITSKYTAENKIEGNVSEYINDMKSLKDIVDNDQLFYTACLADAIKRKVYINKRIEVTDMIFDAFRIDNTLPQQIKQVLNKYKKQLLNSLDDYQNLVVQLENCNDDEWFSLHYGDKELVQQTYYRKQIADLIKVRFSYDKVDFNIDLLEFEEDEITPTFQDLDFFIDLLESSNQPLELNELKYEGMSLGDKLNDIGIKKTVYYEFLKGTDTEFSKQLFYSMNIFLSFSGDYAENFLNINGLSYMTSKLFNASIYKAMFDYGLHSDYANYMMSIQEANQYVKPKAKPINELSPITKFKRNFDANRDYFERLDRLKKGVLNNNEINDFKTTLTTLHQLIEDWIIDHLEKDKKRLATIQNYESQMLYDKNSRRRKTRPELPVIWERSVNYDKLERLVQSNKRFLYHNLSDIINKSTLESPWQKYEHVKIKGGYPEGNTIFSLMDEIENTIRDILLSS